jgi:S1-C subfamily serine protease
MRLGFRMGRCLRPAALALVMALGGLGAAAAAPQVECHLPSGQIVTTGRSECREKIGLILREVTPPAAVMRTGDPVESDAQIVGGGTGFFVTQSGIVITAEHVVARCDSLVVASEGNQLGWARVLGRDRAVDLALVETGQRPKAVASLRPPPDAVAGDTMFTVTLPFVSLFQQFDVDTVKIAWVPPVDSPTSMDFDGLVKPGMSGGPLIDAHGRVAGVVSAGGGEATTFGDKKRYPYGQAVQGAALRKFLAQQHVPFASGASQPTRAPAAIEQLARAMTVAVLCTEDR